MSNKETQIHCNEIIQDHNNETIVCNNKITTFAAFLAPDNSIKSTDDIAPHAILANFSQLVCSAEEVSISCKPNLPDACGDLATKTTVYAVRVTGCIPFIVSAPITRLETDCKFMKKGKQIDGTPLLPTTSTSGIAVANNIICISRNPDICTVIEPLLCKTQVEITELFRCTGPDARGKSIQLTFTLPSRSPV